MIYAVKSTKFPHPAAAAMLSLGNHELQIWWTRSQGESVGLWEEGACVCDVCSHC